MPFKQQARLAISSQGMLCFTRPSLDPFTPTGPCPINELAIELLTLILHYTSTVNHAPLLVCARWRLAYEPILHRKVTIGDEEGWEATRYQRRLTQVFTPDCAVGRYVRLLYLTLNHPKAVLSRLFINIINECPGITSLSLHSMSLNIQPIFEAVGRLSRLENLDVGARRIEPGGFPLQMIVPNVRRCPLKTLRLSRHGLGEEHTPGVEWAPQSYTAPQSMLKEMSRLSQDLSTPIETMCIYEPYTPPAVTELLLNWPNALINIRFGYLCHARYRYNCDDLQRILDRQHASLQEIEIGNYGDLKIPNFSQYCNLRRLSLAMYNLLEEEPVIAAIKLNAPNLAYIRGSFDTEDQHQASCSAFGTAEIDWMQRFVSHKHPGGKLKSLRSMEFDLNPATPYSPHVLPWPWKHIENARHSVFHEAGIELICIPSLTEKEWAQKIAENIE